MLPALTIVAMYVCTCTCTAYVDYIYMYKYVHVPVLYFKLNTVECGHPRKCPDFTVEITQTLHLGQHKVSCLSRCPDQGGSTVVLRNGIYKIIKRALDWSEDRDTMSVEVWPLSDHPKIFLPPSKNFQ